MWMRWAWNVIFRREAHTGIQQRSMKRIRSVVRYRWAAYVERMGQTGEKVKDKTDEWKRPVVTAAARRVMQHDLTGGAYRDSLKIT
jgi:hypothetical protein